MSSCCKAYIVAFAGTLALVLCAPAIAQQSADLITHDQTGSASAPQATAADDDNWHLAISPYLWFAGVHGTVGGGGAQVDYQVAGLLGYKIKPTVMLGAGWRYLDVNYRPSSSFVYDVAQRGLLLGVTFNLR
ncbi:MAG TPA: hypothetical protein VK578_00830 [Edaphobacter sp.]|nr:hypothetical protein [Edaphobacter sp.]